MDAELAELARQEDAELAAELAALARLDARFDREDAA